MGALCLQWLRRISAEIVWIVSVSLGYGIMLVLARPAKVGRLLPQQRNRWGAVRWAPMLTADES
jgi:hypothetical protein